MQPIRTILFPTDFSACAEHAFGHAAYLADRFKAELHVLHVLDVRPYDSSVYLGGNTPVEFMSPPVVVDVPSPYPEMAGERGVQFVEAQVEHTSIPEGILTYASEQQADLIVMGTHGRRGADRLLMGSVAEEVVRLADCLVLTVGARAPESQQVAMRHILVPTDLSEHAAEALRQAAAWAELEGARLHILHVLERTPMPGIYELEAAYVNTPAVRARAEEELRTWAEQAIGADHEATYYVRFGYPPRDIVDVAKNRAMDLIVMATHGRTGLQRVLLGSVAEKVVRMAVCPVLAVRGVPSTEGTPDTDTVHAAHS